MREKTNSIRISELSPTKDDILSIGVKKKVKTKDINALVKEAMTEQLVAKGVVEEVSMTEQPITEGGVEEVSKSYMGI